MTTFVNLEPHASLAHIGTLWLNLAPPNFTLSKQAWEQLCDAFTTLSSDPPFRVVILRGPAGGPFSSGADLHEILAIRELDKATGGDRGAKDYWRLVNYANTAIETCPLPVIALIERYALGAGCALAMACDFRAAASTARIGVPAPQRGLTLGLNDTRRLVAAVGAAVAKEVLLEGKIYSARDAYRLGLVNKIAAPGQLEREVEALAARLASENGPLAMKEAKANIAMVVRNPGLVGIDDTSTPIAWAGSNDLEEGIRAFFEKRPPVFGGH